MSAVATAGQRCSPDVEVAAVAASRILVTKGSLSWKLAFAHAQC